MYLARRAINYCLPYLHICMFAISLGLTSSVIAKEATNLYATRLNTAGWSINAANAVTDLHRLWFDDLATNQPQALELILKNLEPLGDSFAWQRLLALHPESTGLVITAEDRRLLLSVLSGISNTCWPFILQQYIYLTAPEDAAMLTKILKLHHRSICKLARLGVPGAAAIYMFDSKQDGAREYTRWLEHDLIGAALYDAKYSSNLDTKNDILAVAVTFAMFQGPVIRDRMLRDPSFRQRLPGLYQALQRAVSGYEDRNERIALISFEPKIWDLLLLEQGEAILANWGPEIPIALLFSPVALPSDIQYIAIDAFYNKHLDIINLLQNHLDDANLHSLMRRPDFSKPQMERVLVALDGKCPDCPDGYTKRLAYFKRLSPAAISDQFAPSATGIVAWMPFTKEVTTINKIVQGRQVSAIDYAMLGFSIATTFIPFSQVAGVAGNAFAKVAPKLAGKVVLMTSKAELVKTQVMSTIKDAVHQVAPQIVLTTYHFHPGDLKAAKIDKPNFGRGLPISAQRRSFLKPRWNHDRQERTNLLKTQCSGSCCL
ncbi:hypothetical protein TI04_05820, partial [Achromatium sp. WMS2]